MLLNFEKILNFILYLYSLNLNFYLYSRKNFFLGKLGILNLLIKNVILKKIFFIINFYKKKILKLFFTKFLLKNFVKNEDFKLFNNYNYNYYNNLLELNKLNFIIKKLLNIFVNLGFFFIKSCEIDNDCNNFYLLNISKNHPSLNFNDTFYLNCDFYNKILLRTHSSNFQSILKYKNKTLKFFTIGKVYRPDYGNLHLPIFNQLDLVWIDFYINFLFMKNFFLKFLNLFFLYKKFCYRLRSSYFPFTNISYEADLLINLKNKFWLEFSGFGIMNKKILNFININSEIYKGFALGAGIERLFMIYYNIDNLNIFR